MSPNRAIPSVHNHRAKRKKFRNESMSQTSALWMWWIAHTSRNNGIWETSTGYRVQFQFAGKKSWKYFLALGQITTTTRERETEKERGRKKKKERRNERKNHTENTFFFSFTSLHIVQVYDGADLLNDILRIVWTQTIFSMVSYAFVYDSIYQRLTLFLSMRMNILNDILTFRHSQIISRWGSFRMNTITKITFTEKNSWILFFYFFQLLVFIVQLKEAESWVIHS